MIRTMIQPWCVELPQSCKWAYVSDMDYRTKVAIINNQFRSCLFRNLDCYIHEFVEKHCTQLELVW